MKRINKILGTRYWYAIRFIYKKDGVKMFDFIANIGLSEKRTILKNREIKAINMPLHKLDFIPKRLLINGDVSFEVVSYLGWFKK